MLPSSLPDALRSAAERGGADDGLTFLDRRESETRLDWKTVHERSLRAAATLRRAGVKAGDRVAIIVPTDPVFFDAFLGCHHIGAIPAPLYPPVRLGRFDEYVERTAAMLRVLDAKAIVATRQVARVLGQVVQKTHPPLGILSAERLIDEAPFVNADLPSADAIALVQFSSGTTQDPKPVALTHRHLLANADAIIDILPGARQGQRQAGVSWLPLYHDMGLIGCLLPAIMLPGHLTLLPPEVFLTRPALWLRALSHAKAVISPAPNFAYSLCNERIRDEELEGVDLSAWRLALNGAEPVSASTVRRFVERFSAWGLRETAPTPVYGLSEAALAVTFSDRDTPFRAQHFDRDRLAQGEAKASDEADASVELVSVGRPLRGFAVDIRGPLKNSLPEGQEGRVWVAGPSVMERYLDDRPAPVEAGWLDTGDRGFILDGELFITGRDKDVIVLRGRNHHPTDIERAADSVAGVRQGCAAAVGELSDEGERLVLFVEVRERADGQAEEVRKSVVAAAGVDPSLVVLLDPGTLPRTSSGKIRRAETLARWRAETLVPPANVTPWMLAGTLAKSALGYLQSR